MNRRNFGFGVAALALALLLGAAWLGPISTPDDKKKEEAARVAKVEELFQSLKDTLKDFNSKFKGTLVATVQYEKLIDAKNDLKNDSKTWQCDKAFVEAKEKSKDARQELRTISDRLKTKIDAAKGAASGLGAAQLPWGSDLDSVNKTTSRARELFTDVNSSKTAAGPKGLANLWTKVQAYASGIPDCLPSAKAEEMVPQTVTVPCIMKSVTMR